MHISKIYEKDNTTSHNPTLNSEPEPAVFIRNNHNSEISAKNRFGKRRIINPDKSSEENIDRVNHNKDRIAYYDKENDDSGTNKILSNEKTIKKSNKKKENPIDPNIRQTDKFKKSVRIKPTQEYNSSNPNTIAPNLYVDNEPDPKIINGESARDTNAFSLDDQNENIEVESNEDIPNNGNTEKRFNRFSL